MTFCFGGPPYMCTTKAAMPLQRLAASNQTLLRHRTFFPLPAWFFSPHRRCARVNEASRTGDRQQNPIMSSALTLFCYGHNCQRHHYRVIKSNQIKSNLFELGKETRGTCTYCKQPNVTDGQIDRQEDRQMYT